MLGKLFLLNVAGSTMLIYKNKMKV